MLHSCTITYIMDRKRWNGKIIDQVSLLLVIYDLSSLVMHYSTETGRWTWNSWYWIVPKVFSSICTANQQISTTTTTLLVPNKLERLTNKSLFWSTKHSQSYKAKLDFKRTYIGRIDTDQKQWCMRTNKLKT